MSRRKCVGLAIHSIFRISGNAASDKNIKDGVCAQIEKNFAKAKWKVKQSFFVFVANKCSCNECPLHFSKVHISLTIQYVLSSFMQKAVRVTTLMKRLRAPDQSDSGASSPALGASAGSVTPSSTPVAVAATPEPPSSAIDLQVVRAGEAPARCNGEIPAPLQPSVETREEQNG